jgi:hypothetical protein
MRLPLSRSFNFRKTARSPGNQYPQVSPSLKRQLIAEHMMIQYLANRIAEGAIVQRHSIPVSGDWISMDYMAVVLTDVLCDFELRSTTRHGV